MMQRNPKANTFKIPNGYTDLGWQLHPEHSAWRTVKTCREKKHTRREFDNSLFKNRCTDVITICDECKYIYHTDMSD